MNGETYMRRVHYYETDRMGIVHHSNYIRWFEEGRVSFLRKNGINCGEMEAMGIQMAVTAVNCEFKSPTEFDEIVAVETHLVTYNGVRAVFEYKVIKENSTVAAVGSSEHCFITAGKGLPLNMKKKMPSVSTAMFRLLKEAEEGTEEKQ